MYLFAAFPRPGDFGLPVWMALGAFVGAMLALGMGNGAVFQLVPQRFKKEIRRHDRLVGMAGGVGGFPGVVARLFPAAHRQLPVGFRSSPRSLCWR